MNKLSLRILAMLMAIMMILTVSSIVVFADDTDTEDGLISITSVLGAENDDETATEITEAEATEAATEETTEAATEETTEAATEETTEAATEATEEVKSTEEATTSDTPVVTTGETETTTDKKENWFTKHISFVIAMGIIVVLVGAYFIARLVSVKFREKSTNFWKDYRTQFSKLSWPSKEQFWKNAAVVFSAIIIFGVILALLDWGISKLVYLLKDLMDLILPAGK